jgi:hypothetical protein
MTGPGVVKASIPFNAANEGSALSTSTDNTVTFS